MTVRESSHKAAPAQMSWPVAIDRLRRELVRFALPIVLLAALFALVAVAVRMTMPQTYRATAELLIDPRGLQVFKNELVAGQYDANAAVNYVESQIHVILSTRVLSQALRQIEGEQPVSAAAIEAVRKNISVTRAERSYILSVTAKAATPQGAADLANAVLKAYLDEDTASRAGVAQRLTDDLGSRLDQLRRRLAESEQLAEDYRRRNNLVSADGKLIVDQQLAAAVIALGEADERLSTMRVRHSQLLSNDANAIETLAGTADQARLNLLISRRTAAREEVARLSARLGSRHPTLLSAMQQLQEVEALTRAEHARIRSSSETALAQAEQERDGLTAIVARLTEQSDAARGSSIELRALEQQTVSDRELLSSFETRSREMAEFAHIDSANVRMLSTAYPPQGGRGIAGMLVWAVAGALFGAMLGVAWAVLRTALALTAAPAMARPDTPQAVQPPRRTAPPRAAPMATPRARPRSLLDALPPSGPEGFPVRRPAPR